MIQRPATAVVPKLKKQIERMTKIKSSCTSAPRGGIIAYWPGTRQGGPSADPAGTFYLLARRGPRAAQSTPNLVIPEVFPGPARSPLKRYTDIDNDVYQDLVKAARWVFVYMQSFPGGASRCTMRPCIDSASTASPVPPVSKERLQSYFGNRYLPFENIRTAALRNEFTLIQFAYYRNATLVADRAAANPGRQKFIAWEVELLRSRSSSAGKMSMSQDELLAAWNALPDMPRPNALPDEGLMRHAPS